MKNKKYILIILAVLVVILICGFIYTRNNKKTDLESNSVKFFEQMISIDNFKLFLADEHDKMADNFKDCLNERGLAILLNNRIVRFNFGYILKHDIQSYENLKVELLKESSEGKETYKDYKITYTYIDSKNNQYDLTDYYTLNYIDGKIDYIKFHEDESSIGKDMTQ